MKLVVLAEDTASSEKFEAEHGLSIYIETGRHKILFDLGAGELFSRNAVKMGIDLRAVDIAVISHGHSDHGGGLASFLDLNQKAIVYINKTAFEKHYSNKNDRNVYIGLDRDAMREERIVFSGDRYVIDSGLVLFSGVRLERSDPSVNRKLLKEDDEKLVRDDFSHEQNLLVHEGGSTILFTGCAHKGIINILEYVRNELNERPSHVIGGFHLYSRANDMYEDMTVLEQIAAYLKKTGAHHYTCHCTGVKAYKRLKEVLGGDIEYLTTGRTLNI